MLHVHASGFDSFSSEKMGRIKILTCYANFLPENNNIDALKLT